MAKKKKIVNIETPVEQVEVAAENVVAVDADNNEIALTELEPELAGETVVVDTAEALPEITEENINDIKEAPAITEPMDEVKAEEPIVEKPKAKRKPRAAKTKAEIKTKTKGIEIKNLAWCYPSSIAHTATKTITGTVYLWDETPVTGRYAVTTIEDVPPKLSISSLMVIAPRANRKSANAISLL